MKATLPSGDLSPIPKCDIVIPGISGCAGCNPNDCNPDGFTICLKINPEISDTKSSAYQDESVIGRSFPIKTYSHGENRTISMKVTFVILKPQDAIDNMKSLRALQSAVYPRDGGDKSPYLPPPICKIRCGNLLAGTKGASGYLCAVLKQYTVVFPPDVAWYQSEQVLYLPYKFSVDLSWDIVYANTNLPGQDKIFGDI